MQGVYGYKHSVSPQRELIGMTRKFEVNNGV